MTTDRAGTTVYLVQRDGVWEARSAVSGARLGWHQWRRTLLAWVREQGFRVVAEPEEETR